jgi:hypothetical protein
MPYLMNCLMSIATLLLLKIYGTKKFVASNSLHFQMTDEKSITSQIQEFHNIVAKLTKKGDGLPKNVLLKNYRTLGRSINSISNKRKLS